MVRLLFFLRWRSFPRAADYLKDSRVFSGFSEATDPGFRFLPPDKTRVQALVRPFYDLTENYPYRMYVDVKDVPFELWKA